MWALCGFGVSCLDIEVCSIPLWIITGCAGTFLFAIGVSVWMAYFVMKDVGLDDAACCNDVCCNDVCCNDGEHHSASHCAIEKHCVIEKDAHQGKHNGINHQDKRNGINHQDKRNGINHQDKRNGINHQDKRNGINHQDKRNGINHQDKRNGINHHSIENRNVQGVIGSAQEVTDND